MRRLVLMDNDAALKLARYDLLNEALHALRCTPAQVRVLATAGYTLLPAHRQLRHCKDDACADRLREFLRQVGKADTSTADPPVLDTLAAIPGIDSGEALLLALAAGEPDAVIVTGDKRALQALCTAPEAAGAVAALAGRVICMEILFRTLTRDNFELTRSRVRANGDVDTALAAVFGVATPATLESVQQGLDSYDRALRAQTGSLLRASVAD